MLTPEELRLDGWKCGSKGPWHTLDHRGCKGNRLPMRQHQCTVFNDAAAACPMEEWPHDSFTFAIEEGELVEVAGEMYPTPGHNNCGFRVFRLRLLQNRMDSNNMYVQGIELYGDLFVPNM